MSLVPFCCLLEELIFLIWMILTVGIRGLIESSG